MTKSKLNADDKAISDQAVAKLKNDDVVAMPTETVYGLAGRIGSERALKKIFSTKKRPFFDPLIVHVSSIEQAKMCYQMWNPIAEKLAARFWPGPLTMVMPKSDRVSSLITSGLETVAVRWPAHPIAQKLIQMVGEPLAAPSANLFGKTSPTKAEHVREQFGDEVFILDGGSSEFGIESTVLLIQTLNPSQFVKNLHGESHRVVSESTSKVESHEGIVDHYELSILRPGSVTKAQIEDALQALIQNSASSSAQELIKWSWKDKVESRLAPGQMKHHYMPNKPLIILKPARGSMAEEQIRAEVQNALAHLPDEVEGVKIFKPQKIESFGDLQLSDDPVLAARELYSSLRESAEANVDVIIFRQKTEQTGELWTSVFDRLYKAASLIIE